MNISSKIPSHFDPRGSLVSPILGEKIDNTGGGTDVLRANTQRPEAVTTGVSKVSSPDNSSLSP